jgi:transcriptional regulator NrdR family protein
MKCPACKAQTLITQVEEHADGATKRWRECPKCKRTFTTTERRDGLRRKKNTQTAVDKFLATALGPTGGQA